MPKLFEKKTEPDWFQFQTFLCKSPASQKNLNDVWKLRLLLYKGGLKYLCDDIESSVYNFFDQWYPSTATWMEEVCGLQGDYVER